MLISFKVSNFKSILDPVCLNMLADLKDQTLAQNLYNLEGIEEKVNPFSVIMGANGSGKSSIFEALHFTREIFLRRGETISRNKLAPRDMPSVFEICYCAPCLETRCRSLSPIQKYILEVLPSGLVNERLMTLENGIWKESWQHDFISLPESAENENELNVDWENESFFDILRYENLQDAITFFQNIVFFISIDNNLDQFFSLDMSDDTCNEIDNLPSEIRALTRMDTKEKQILFKTLLIKLLNTLGIGVIDLGFKFLGKDIQLDGYALPHGFIDSQGPASNNDLAESDDDYEIDDITDCLEETPEADFIELETYALETLRYKNYEMPIQEESSGTKRLVKLAYTMLNGLLRSEDLIFIVDEMDAGLHDALSAEVVRQFFILSKKMEEYNGSGDKELSQLIITSHNTVLLRDGNIRKDQIWFAEMKEENRTTDLYSLADLKGVKSTEDFAENYLRGAYGAVPQRSFAREEENADE